MLLFSLDKKSISFHTFSSLDPYGHFFLNLRCNNDQKLRAPKEAPVFILVALILIRTMMIIKGESWF